MKKFNCKAFESRTNNSSLTLAERCFFNLKVSVEELIKNALFSKSGNIKLGDAIWAMFTLMGSDDYFFHYGDEMLSKFFKGRVIVPGTCQDFCKGCIQKCCNRITAIFCYVWKSYVQYWKTVPQAHAIRTICMLCYPDQWFAALTQQIKNAKHFVTIRWNVSGEITDEDNFLRICKMMRDTYGKSFLYLYTKAFSIITPVFEAGLVPDNITVNISIWGENGIAAFHRLKKFSQIRTFVVITKEYTKEWYAERGIVIDAMCPAYRMNAKGKVVLMHEEWAKCGQCRLCIDKAGFKVIGCLEHK